MKECNQCGKCCIKYSNGGLSASEEEIKFWDIFKPNIYKYVLNKKIWYDPDSGEQLEICPWLRKMPNQNKYTCDIYFDRPEDCKYYPVTIEQMIQDNCKMIEERDLLNPNQAQKTLDKIMMNSRPGF